MYSTISFLLYDQRSSLALSFHIPLTYFYNSFQTHVSQTYVTIGLIMFQYNFIFNPLNAELNPICHLLALLGGANIVVVSRLRVNSLETILLLKRNWLAWYALFPSVILFRNVSVAVSVIVWTSGHSCTFQVLNWSDVSEKSPNREA